MTTPISAGRALRDRIATAGPLPFIGIYDAFSASLAARHYEALFVSGFGFAASRYGLPDVGFVAWPDILDFVRRLRAVLPRHHLLVDVDDGYTDPDVACHVVAQLELLGASGVVLEDQARPRRCGHFDGKRLLPIAEYVDKLRAVLRVRRDLVVIARTDAVEPDDIAARARAYAAAGADALLVDGLRDLSTVSALARELGRPFAFNQIGGGKSPRYTLTELGDGGVSLVIYSTPCLFAAQAAIADALIALQEADGLLPEPAPDRFSVRACTAVLEENMERALGAVPLPASEAAPVGRLTAEGTAAQP